MSETIAQLFVDATSRTLTAGEFLFHAGDPIRSMFLVEGGALNLTRATGSGTTIVLQRAEAGQVLAEASAYSASYHCDARALDDAVLRAIPIGLFRRRISLDSGLAEVWARHLAHAVQSARMRAEIRTLRTVRERLDAWLGEGCALPPKGNWQNLAAELGVSREALYRELGKRRRMSRGSRAIS